MDIPALIEKCREKSGYFERLDFQILAADFKEMGDALEMLWNEKKSEEKE